VLRICKKTFAILNFPSRPKFTLSHGDASRSEVEGRLRGETAFLQWTHQLSQLNQRSQFSSGGQGKEKVVEDGKMGERRHTIQRYGVKV